MAKQICSVVSLTMPFERWQPWQPLQQFKHISLQSDLMSGEEETTLSLISFGYIIYCDLVWTAPFSHRKHCIGLHYPDMLLLICPFHTFVMLSPIEVAILSMKYWKYVLRLGDVRYWESNSSTAISWYSSLIHSLILIFYFQILSEFNIKISILISSETIYAREERHEMLRFPVS